MSEALMPIDFFTRLASLKACNSPVLNLEWTNLVRYTNGILTDLFEDETTIIFDEADWKTFNQIWASPLMVDKPGWWW